LVLQSRTDGHPGLLVVDVTAGSPFDGTLRQGDVILKLNSATPTGPQTVIGTIERDHRASVSLQHDGEGVPNSTELILPKDTDE
jgi:S1-C subfamily serine protease